MDGSDKVVSLIFWKMKEGQYTNGHWCCAIVGTQFYATGKTKGQAQSNVLKQAGRVASTEQRSLF